MNDSSVNPLPNPLSAHRLASGKSLDQLAREIGVSISTLIRTEQGCYNGLPPIIARYLATLPSSTYVSVGSLNSDYRRFQSAKRNDLYLSDRIDRYYRSLLTEAIKKAPDKNPFILFREIFGYKSRLSFCKDLCLHPATVKRVEDGVAVTIPESILEALDEIAVETETLSNEYRKYRVERNSNTETESALVSVGT